MYNITLNSPYIRSAVTRAYTFGIDFSILVPRRSSLMFTLNNPVRNSLSTSASVTWCKIIPSKPRARLRYLSPAPSTRWLEWIYTTLVYSWRVERLLVISNELKLKQVHIFSWCDLDLTAFYPYSSTIRSHFFAQVNTWKWIMFTIKWFDWFRWF